MPRVQCMGKLLRLFAVVATSVGVLFGVEQAVLSSLGGAWPLGFAPELAPRLLTVGLLLAAFLLLRSLSDRFLFSLLATSLAALAVCAVHVRKMAVLDKPLMPWDFFEARHVVALWPTVASARELALVAGMGIPALLLLAVSLRRGRWPLGWKRRTVIAMLSSAYIGGLVMHAEEPVKIALKLIRVENRIWDQRENLARNGLLLCTVLNSRSLLVRLPGYSEGRVRAVADRFPKPAEASPDPADPVDVILYMGESFWDPTRLPLELSEDPIPTLRRLLTEHPSGELVSSTYGGGTSNIEFEILTGLTTTVLPEGAYPYQHYLSRPVESVASVLKDHGYRTLTVHNFHRWYWEREVVYPLIGIERFVALDELEPVVREGPYPSDEPLIDRVIAELEQGTEARFILAISMVSHGPYGYPSAPGPRVTVTKSALTPKAVQEVENHASALKRADHALGRLVRHLESRTRRTLLVVLGDHLPSLEAFRETGRSVTKPTPEQAEWMELVPVAFWANYPLARTSLGRVSMTFLGPRVLEAAGFPAQGYFGYLGQVSEALPVVHRQFVRTGAGALLPVTEGDVEGAAELSNRLRELRMLAYDRLIGQRYSAGERAVDRQ